MTHKTIVRKLIAALEEAMAYGQPAYSRSGKRCMHCEYPATGEFGGDHKHERDCETVRLEKLIKDAKAMVKELA